MKSFILTIIGTLLILAATATAIYAVEKGKMPKMTLLVSTVSTLKNALKAQLTKLESVKQIPQVKEKNLQKPTATRTNTPKPKPITEQLSFFVGLYINTKYHFALEHPDMYSQKVIDDEHIQLLLAKNGKPVDSEPRVYITVTKNVDEFIKTYNERTAKMSVAHMDETMDIFMKTRHGTVAGINNFEYISHATASAERKESFSIGKTFNKNGTIINIYSIRKNKEELNAFRDVFDFIANSVNFIDSPYYTDTSSWQVYSDSYVKFKYPLNYWCTIGTKHESGYSIVCKDEYTSQIEIKVFENTNGLTLENALKNGTMTNVSEDDKKNLSVSKLTIDNVDGLRADNIVQPREGLTSEVVFIKNNTIYAITAQKENGIIALDRFIENFHVSVK